MAEPVHQPRRVLLVTHTGREHAVDVARKAHRLLTDAGITVRVAGGEAEVLDLEPVEVAHDPD
ncbi:MAG: NAD kinase, partial [Nocardioidaceae bacterium]